VLTVLASHGHLTAQLIREQADPCRWYLRSRPMVAAWPIGLRGAMTLSTERGGLDFNDQKCGEKNMSKPLPHGVIAFRENDVTGMAVRWAESICCSCKGTTPAASDHANRSSKPINLFSVLDGAVEG
jgi:hypothetical protein